MDLLPIYHAIELAPFFEVTRCVTRLARIFNRWGIMALRDMRKILTRRGDKYESIVVGIEEGIKRISKTRSSLET
jgi:hypothetical protein